MNAAPSLETFAKVRALHDRTTHPGEKAAAASKMHSLAKAAGMNVAQAVSTLDKPKPPSPAASAADFFNELFNSPEARARRADRDRELAERRAALLARYGTEEAMWEPCVREGALDEACKPVIVRKPIIGGEMDTLPGWDGGRWSQMPAPAQEAVNNAYAAPPTVRETWGEFDYWERRVDEMVAFCPDMDAPLRIRARTAFLENRLDTLPASSLNDVRARLAWMAYLDDRGWDRGHPEDRILLDCLMADVERLGALIREQGPVQNGRSASEISAGSGENSRTPDLGSGIGDIDPAAELPNVGSSHFEPVHSGHVRRTNADKRRDVLALLGQGLADREIARRAGVSPQMVGNVRRSMSNTRPECI